jgi:hypothetical protein
MSISGLACPVYERPWHRAYPGCGNYHHWQRVGLTLPVGSTLRPPSHSRKAKGGFQSFRKFPTFRKIGQGGCRVGRRCQICSNTSINIINRALLGGAKLSEIARRYGLGVGPPASASMQCLGLPTSQAVTARRDPRGPPNCRRATGWQGSAAVPTPHGRRHELPGAILNSWRPS